MDVGTVTRVSLGVARDLGVVEVDSTLPDLPGEITATDGTTYAASFPSNAPLLLDLQ